MLKFTSYSLLLVMFLQFVITSSKLTIISPSLLAGKVGETVPFVPAVYGKVPFGAHFVGGLANTKPLDGCGKIEHFLAGEIEFDQNIIAVVKKGNCTNTIKTRNAELAGAKMLIIVDDQDNWDESQQLTSGVSTDNIHIPTIIIPKKQGEQIIQFIEKLPFPPIDPEAIVPIISITFPFDNISDKVTLDFWMSSADRSSYDFLVKLSPHIFPNLNVFDFRPHYVTWDCYYCKRSGYTIQATNDCISMGRYCAPDPDKKEGGLAGEDVLLEDLRQICFSRQFPLLWWDYVESYQTCIDNPELEACSLKLLGGKKQDIVDCVQNSFVTPTGEIEFKTTNDNKILSGEKELQLEYDISEFPVLLINHKPFGGDLTDIQEVMEEICKNLKDSAKQTNECKKYLVSSTSAENISTTTGPGVGAVLLVIFLLIVSGVLIVFFFRRTQKRRTALEISTVANDMVSRYMAIKDVQAGSTKEEDNDNGA